jgi:hypothetical protein
LRRGNLPIPNRSHSESGYFPFLPNKEPIQTNAN